MTTANLRLKSLTGGSKEKYLCGCEKPKKSKRRSRRRSRKGSKRRSRRRSRKGSKRRSRRRSRKGSKRRGSCKGASVVCFKCR